MELECFLPTGECDLADLNHEVTAHGGQVAMGFLGTSPDDVRYFLHLPDDPDRAEACREVCRARGMILEN
ncbi:MAG: hypothetical protein QM747_03235 [Nocardioides sp.]